MKNIRIYTVEEVLKTLNNPDRELIELVKFIGDIEMSVSSAYFESLMMSIIGQQLSAKSATTIKNRVRLLFADINPNTVKQVSSEELRNAGVSRSKTFYIHDLCDKVMSGQLDFSILKSLPSNEVIEHLTVVKGIGKWTAEMFLIFSLGRTDILSISDSGLQRAAKWLYQMPIRIDGNYLGQHGHKWTPYQSIISLYLWKAIDSGLVDSTKTIEEISSGL